MLDVKPFLPAIEPMTGAEFQDMPWKGALAHIGPLDKMTPLQVALTEKTNCALYLIYIGCVGICAKRTAMVLPQEMTGNLVEAIYAYQFDWRYPRPYHIALAEIEDRKSRAKAIIKAIPYFFFEMLSRMPTFFLSDTPFDETSHIINLTRHLGGKANANAIDGWVKGMIERLDKIAPQMEEIPPSIYDFPDRSAWESAVRIVHGLPLPIELLDLNRPAPSGDLVMLARSHMAHVDAAQNPLLRPSTEFKTLDDQAKNGEG